MVTIEDLLKEIDTALKDFGEYTYFDKGPREVIDLMKLRNQLIDMPAEDVKNLIVELSTHSHNPDACGLLARSLISNLDDWDDLFQYPEIENLY